MELCRATYETVRPSAKVRRLTTDAVMERGLSLVGQQKDGVLEEVMDGLLSNAPIYDPVLVQAVTCTELPSSNYTEAFQLAKAISPYLQSPTHNLDN